MTTMSTPPTPNQPTPDQYDKLDHLIKDIKICMMTTSDGGLLRSRPMWVKSSLRDGADRKLWFFTKQSAAKVDEIRDESDVNLSFADPGSDEFVSVSGKARVSRDREKIKDLWDVSLKAWFPDGPESQDIALISVEPTAAEYWDVPSSAMVHLWGIVKAATTGESPSPGETAKVDL